MNYWNREAQRCIRVMLARGGVNRKTLVAKLADIGVKTTEAAIANRIYRGTPTLAFALQIAAALDIDRLELLPSTSTSTGRMEPPAPSTATK